MLFGLLGVVGRLGTHFHWLHLHPLLALLWFGVAVIAAAFLLSWASEALQRDLSSGLAMAILALIAVTPEYSVDFYLTWRAAHDFTYAHHAAANMTGANRLLIGVGWALVVFMHVLYVKRKSKNFPQDDRSFGVALVPEQTLDLFVLTVATVWGFSIPWMGRIAPWHGIGMLLIFAYYIWRLQGHAEKEAHLEGVALFLGAFPKRKRRIVVALLLLFCMGVLLSSAAPFTDSLLDTGDYYHINKTRLIQWLAPLASEAPELMVALIFAWRGQANMGLAALVSSKVNQWTLLVGTLPFVYSASKKEWAALPLDTHQVQEFVLTAAQGLMGIAILSNGRLERWEAALLLLLFLIQLPFEDATIRYGMSILYIAIALVLFFRARKIIKRNVSRLFYKKPIPATPKTLSA